MTTKQIEKQIDREIQKALSGVTVNIMDLSKISREVEEAVGKGEPPERAARRIVPCYQVSL